MPASMRVKDAAEAVLTCIIDQVVSVCVWPGVLGEVVGRGKGLGCVMLLSSGHFKIQLAWTEILNSLLPWISFILEKKTHVHRCLKKKKKKGISIWITSCVLDVFLVKTLWSWKSTKTVNTPWWSVFCLSKYIHMAACKCTLKLSFASKLNGT